MTSPKRSFEILERFEVPALRKKQWIWWSFSLYYFIPLFYLPFDAWRFTAILLAFVVFLGLSFWAGWLDVRRVWLPLSGILLLAVFMTPLTPGTSTFFTYAGFFMGFCLPLSRLLPWLAVTLGIIVSLYLLHSYPLPVFLMPSAMGLITIGLVGRMERIRLEAKLMEERSEAEVRQLATIAERERIARDLHDLLGHTLSSVVLKAELADKLLQQQQTDAARQHMRELHDIARESLSLVRQTVSGYKHRGLCDEVMQLCEKLREHGFSVSLHGDIPQVPPQTETALILALTELTTNILRHSKGNLCELRFEQQAGQLQISVHDNGQPADAQPGNGLNGIRERMQSLAGDLGTDIQQGFHCIITLPREEPNA